VTRSSATEPEASARFPRVVLSTGVGRIHFIETSTALWDAGEDVRLITGWVPSGHYDGFVDAAGWLVGKPNLSRRLAVRRTGGSLPSERILTCAIAEGIAAVGQRFCRSNGVTWPTVSRIVWQNFGRVSRKYLHSADILHVRSGAGQGGAIHRAKELGMLTVADHSIAHPAFMEKALNPLFARYGMPPFAGANDAFWDLVLQDCKDADVILVNSDFVRDTFVNEGFGRSNIKVAYLGVRSDFVSLKTDYSLHTPVRLLFTGGFNSRKGAGDLLDAVTALNRRSAQYQLTVVGSLAESLVLMNHHRAPSNSRFEGMVLQDALKSYLRDSDIYVFPTLAEGCAKSAMEALAAGLPVITTRECGLPVEHLKQAYLVPSGDPLALEVAIDLLARDEPLRRQLGKAGAALVKAKYSWAEYGRTVKAMHMELLRH
jgi:glycosyltransferase involved in cell wall biosynthesis